MVRGRWQPLTLTAEVSSPDGNSATVATEVDIDRAIFGMSWAKMGAGLKNHVSVRAHFDRDSA